MCHAFNFSGYRGDQAYHQQGALNVSVYYPIHALEVRDRTGGNASWLARKALTLRADTALGNLAAAGDVLVLLPPTVANCRGAAAMARSVECGRTPSSGDAVAAGTLIEEVTDEEGETTTVALHLHHTLRLDAGEYVVHRRRHTHTPRRRRRPARHATARCAHLPRTIAT